MCAPLYEDLDVIYLYSALFWLMVWCGGSVYADPFVWLIAFYKETACDPLYQKAALIPLNYAAVHTVKFLKARGETVLEEDAVTHFKAAHYRTIATGGYKVLTEAKKATHTRKEWLALGLYKGLKKETAAAGEWTGFGIHACRKLKTKIEGQRLIDSGGDSVTKASVLRNLRWTSINMQDIYTMQSSVDRVLKVGDARSVSRLQKVMDTLMSLKIDLHEDVLCSGSSGAALDKVKQSNILALIEEIGNLAC